jgi:hypothetical protein
MPERLPTGRITGGSDLITPDAGDNVRLLDADASGGLHPLVNARRFGIHEVAAT